MNKRIMRAVAILPLALLVIATGCFGAKPVDKPEASTTLTLYSTDPGGPEVQEVLDRAKTAFEQAHRGVTIHYAFTTLDRYFTDLDKLVQSGESPDLIIMGQAEFAPFEEKGYLQNLQPLAKANGDTLSNYYDEAILNLGVVKNRLVALMINVSPVVVAYNTKVFAQANLPVPKDGWTWDDFANTARRLRDTIGAGRNNFQAAVFPPGERLLAPLVLGRGGSYTSPDGTTVKGYLDGKDSVAALQWYRNQAANNVIVTDYMPDVMERMIAGNVGMSVVGYESTRFVGAANKADIAIVGLPRFADGKRVTVAYSNAVGVMKQAKHPQLAWQFMKMLALEKNDITADMLRLTLNASKPVMAEKADDPYIKVQLSEYKYVQRDVMDMNMDWVKVLALFQNGLARSVLGRDDLLTSLSWLATQTDQQLLAYRNARQ